MRALVDRLLDNVHGRIDNSQLKSVQRILRSALVVLATARQLDRSIAVRPTDNTPFHISGAGDILGG